MSSPAQKVDWKKCGDLVPAIVQDAVTGRVLMLGYMNEEALEKTLSGKRVTFYSRSRACLWTKGETSGNTLEYCKHEIDCDGDAILIHAYPAGPTCHLEKTSCFDGDVQEPGFGFIGKLESTIDERIQSRPDDSYTAELAQQGAQRIAKKIGEEGVELALAASQENRSEVVAEAADLVYHLLVLLRCQGMTFAEIARELESRHKA